MDSKIVFVDDNPMILKSLQRLAFDQPKWQCHFFHSAPEVLSFLAITDCDIVVSDIMMGPMDGLELLDILKNQEQYRHIEVIMVTGLEDRSLKQQALARGAVDLLNKPIAHEELTARVNSVLQMISYRRQLEEKNRALEEQLAGAQKMELVGTLAAGTIHDLKNMLVVIGGLGNLMQLTPDNATSHTVAEEKFHRRKKMLLQTVVRAETMARKMLSLCQKEEQTLEVCELTPLIVENIELFHSLLPKTVTINLENPSRKYRLRLNKQYLSQILMNLILNATEAMNNAGTIHIQIKDADDNDTCQIDSQEKQNAYVLISVSDTGPGIESHDLAQIFAPCFTTKKESGGTGLGLFVSNWLINQMQGYMSVESNPLSGASFKILLPETRCFNPHN